jgi:hypothetical protein
MEQPSGTPWPIGLSSNLAEGLRPTVGSASCASICVAATANRDRLAVSADRLSLRRIAEVEDRVGVPGAGPSPLMRGVPESRS